jgi:hypothetical protein
MEMSVGTKYRLLYHSVCSFVGIGTPHPLSRKRVCTPPPPQPKEGEHTRLRVRGWGSPNSDDWRKSLALYLSVGIHYTYRSTVYMPFVTMEELYLMNFDIYCMFSIIGVLHAYIQYYVCTSVLVYI